MISYGTTKVRPATIQDAKDLAPRLRKADLLEIEGSGAGLSPEKALILSVSASTATFCVEDSGRVIALFGAAPCPENAQAGYVWMVSSDALWSIRFTFLKHSAEWCKELFKHYTLLGNLVDSRNIVHIRWLKWLGFRFLRQVPLPSGATFLEFCKLADD